MLNYKKTYLLLLSFTSGLTIMAVEIAASRLLAPFYGTSTFVWTNVIGVIMIALAIGYYLGGKVADARPDLKLLLKLIIATSGFLILIPFISGFLIQDINHTLLLFQSAEILIFVGSLLAVTVIFLLPIMILGMVSPYIIKLLSVIDPQVGKDAGLVFCISTIGSILGTFLPVLVFIPYLGTKKTILIFAIILLIVALFGLLKKKWLLIFCLILLPLLSINPNLIKKADGAIAEDESVYQYMQVVDRDNMRLLKVNEGLGVFSIYNLAPNSILTKTYYDYYNLLPYLNGRAQKQDVLILGLAAGTISSQLNYFFAKNYDLQIDGVEIDQKIIDLGKKYFNLENPSLSIYNQDGRNFLNQTTKKYNSIIIDVYANQLYISFHLTTKEFFSSAHEKLQDNGVLAMNVNALDKSSKLLNNITNTMLLVFKHVYLIQQEKESLNYMVLASNQELDFPQLLSTNIDPQLQPVVSATLANSQEVKFDPNFGFFTDDKAPVEHMTDWMILDYFYSQK